MDKSTYEKIENFINSIETGKGKCTEVPSDISMEDISEYLNIHLKNCMKEFL